MKKEIVNNSFVFYATNLEVIEALEETNKDLAADFMKAVIEYGIYGEYDTNNPMVKALMIQTGFGINKAKDRYAAAVENGKKGGRPKKVNEDKVIELKEQGLTNKQIADELNCSVSSIEKINAKNRKNQKNLNVNDNDNVNENINEKNRKNQKNLNVNDNDNVNENDNKSINPNNREIEEVGDSESQKEKEEKESAAAINFTNFEGTISEFYSCLEDNNRTDIKKAIIDRYKEKRQTSHLILTNALVSETLSNYGIEFTGNIAQAM